MAKKPKKPAESVWVARGNKRRKAAPERQLVLLLGKRLESLAAAHGTVESFIRKLGLSQGTYYNIVTGRGNPTADSIEKMARRLGMSVFDLLGIPSALVHKELAQKGIVIDDLVDKVLSEVGTRYGRNGKT